MRRDHPGGSDAGGGRRSAPRTRHDAEQQADEVAAQLRPGTPLPGELHNGAVPESARRPVEQWAGIDLSGTRLDTRTDPAAVAGGTGTIAAYDHSTIYAGLGAPLTDTPLGQHILRHELVHAAQERTAQTTGQAGRFHALGPLRLNICGGPEESLALRNGGTRESLATLRSGGKLTADQAEGLLNTYKWSSPDDRDAVVREFHKVGDANSGLQRLLAALDPAVLQKRRDLVSDMAERVQRITAEQTAGKTQARLGAEQGAWMKSEVQKRALAAAAAAAAVKGQPPPVSVTPADLTKEHEQETKRTAPVTESDPKAWQDTKPEHDIWDPRAKNVITAVVEACKKRAPGLGITAANLEWAPRKVAEAGGNVYSLSGDPILFGTGFVETVEKDPEYAVRTVVHEIVGHPEFGNQLRSYEALIYAEAHLQDPTLGKPWDTLAEQYSYGYIGTEIYAALREFPYEKPLSPALQKTGVSRAIQPEQNIDSKVGLLKSLYKPGIAEPLLQGLYERFRIDPRITPAAMALFLKAAEIHFKGVLKR